MSFKNMHHKLEKIKLSSQSAQHPRRTTHDPFLLFEAGVSRTIPIQERYKYNKNIVNCEEQNYRYHKNKHLLFELLRDGSMKFITKVFHGSPLPV